MGPSFEEALLQPVQMYSHLETRVVKPVEIREAKSQLSLKSQNVLPRPFQCRRQAQYLKHSSAKAVINTISR